MFRILFNISKETKCKDLVSNFLPFLLKRSRRMNTHRKTTVFLLNENTYIFI